MRNCSSWQLAVHAPILYIYIFFLVLNNYSLNLDKVIENIYARVVDEWIHKIFSLAGGSSPDMNSDNNGLNLPVSMNTENKRKGEDGVENPLAKTKRIEKQKCSDLIVLGLPWKSTEEDLRNYFVQFGELLMVQVRTGSSRII